MSKARNTKKIQFAQEVKSSRCRIQVNGVMACIETQVTTVFPAEVTRNDVLNLVATATADDPDDPNAYWEVVIPGLDTVSWPEREHLDEEVASRLNDYGVSVSDWETYCLDK